VIAFSGQKQKRSIVTSTENAARAENPHWEFQTKRTVRAKQFPPVYP
jgi:hypothetical protein